MNFLIMLALFGGLYGFALYVRDAIRSSRRIRAGGPRGLWLGDHWHTKAMYEPDANFPARPDGQA